MGKTSRAKRLRRQQAAAQQALVDRVQQSLPDERLKVVKRRTGRKVSEMLMEFAKPWFDEARNDDQRRTVIGMAVLAWNMAAFPEPERWEGMSPGFAEKLGEPAKAILKEMIARKLALYPGETRSILDYEVTGSGDNMRVNVIYSLLPEEISDLKHGNQGLKAR
jgi:hypothetical protein